MVSVRSVSADAGLLALPPSLHGDVLWTHQMARAKAGARVGGRGGRQMREMRVMRQGGLRGLSTCANLSGVVVFPSTCTASAAMVVSPKVGVAQGMRAVAVGAKLSIERVAAPSPRTRTWRALRERVPLRTVRTRARLGVRRTARLPVMNTKMPLLGAGWQSVVVTWCWTVVKPGFCAAANGSTQAGGGLWIRTRG